MSIYRVNSNNPTSTKIKQLNDMIFELNGKMDQGRFNKNELDQLFDIIVGDRKYKRNVGLGNTTTTHTGWSHVIAESGYSIWKYTPSAYAHNSLNKVYCNDKVYENRGEASSESATAFDLVYLYDAEAASGESAYTNNTAEAASETGTEFECMDSTSDYLYLGEASAFGGTKFEFHTRGSNYTLKVEYWNGSWTEMTSGANDLEDATNDFQGDGHISWSIPSDWTENTVNSESKYWIRISTTTTPVTTAQAYYIIPKESVVALLALGSSEAQNEEWAWCSYNGTIYVTIKNAGNSSYEGDYYITSASSSTNLENYFVHNNPFTTDYEDSGYNAVKEVSADYEVLDSDGVIFVYAITQNVTLTLPAAHTRDGMPFLIKRLDNTGYSVTIATESGETIDGSGTYSVASQYDYVRLISDNANYFIVGEKIA